MVKIEENENFHPRRKMTSSLKMAAFLEKKIFFPKAPYIKVRNVLKISCSKLFQQFEIGRGPKSSPPGIGLNPSKRFSYNLCLYNNQDYFL